MTELIRGKYWINQGTLYPSEQASIPPEAFRNSIYEVIRVEQYTPVFLFDHFNRLVKSAKKAGLPLPENLINRIHVLVFELIHANGFENGNIKILVSFTKERENLYIYFIPHHFPESTVYEKGVAAGLFEAERENPAAKISRPSLKETIQKFLEKNNLYEALLINYAGRITEGSRSNVFFILADYSVVTAPDELILPGITRYYVIRCIEKLGLNLSYKLLSENDIHTLKAAFLTGTSPKVLPLSRIDEYTLDPKHPHIKAIANCYQQLYDQDIQKNNH